MLDLAIRGGWLIDGLGRDRRRADVGVLGDRIVSVGRVSAANRELDASGLVVAPGFIDPHSHSDWTLHTNRDAASTIRQGVTTEVVGNCGLTNAPVTDGSLPSVAARLRSFGHPDPPTWRSFGDYLDEIETEGTSQNLAFFAGHSTIRAAAGVGAARPTGEQIEVMASLVREAMEAGALGISSGLEYDLGTFADADELRHLVSVVGRFNGIYASHIRNRDSEILAAVREFISVASEGDAAAQLSHLNVRYDTNAPPRAWERAVGLMTDARGGGLDIQADTTPFREGLGAMTGVLPRWVLAHGPATASRLLADPLQRARIREDCDRYWRFISKGQWERVRLQRSREFPEYNGMRFDEIASARGQTPWDSYFDILAAAEERMPTLLLVGELFTEEHLAEMISHPLFSLGVDAYTSSDTGALSHISNSPLPYSGHIRYLTHHVRDKRTIRLEEAIRKMSAMPAQRFGLQDRGVLRERSYADIVVFDFDKLESASTFDNPTVYPSGIELVVVNGVTTVQHGEHLGGRAGRVLHRQP